MKLKKSIIALVTISTLILGNITAFASDEEKNIAENKNIFYEYDYIIDIRNRVKVSSADNFSMKGRENQEEMEYILSDAPEKELLYRASLSKNLLKNYYGYNDKQIEVLREYTGGKLEKHPEVRALLGSFTASLSKVSGYNNGKRVGVIYNWQWTTLPAVRKSDIAAVSWKGVFKNGKTNNIRFNQGKSYANVSYKVSDTSGNVSTFSKKYTSFSTNNLYNGAGVKFTMQQRPSSSGYVHTAYKGSMYIYGDVVLTEYPIVEVSVHAEYGHATGSASIGVSFPAGLNISFSKGVDRLGGKNLIIRM